MSVVLGDGTDSNCKYAFTLPSRYICYIAHMCIPYQRIPTYGDECSATNDCNVCYAITLVCQGTMSLQWDAVTDI